MAQHATRSGALTEAKTLGLSGTHKMPNGKFMPGKTHAAYTKAKARKRSGKTY